MFRVDAVLELDTAPAAAADDLAPTVNYAELAQRLHAALSSEPVDLLETLAQRLADVCLADPLVDAVEITVHKPRGRPRRPLRRRHGRRIRRERGMTPRGPLARRQPGRPRRRPPRRADRACRTTAWWRAPPCTRPRRGARSSSRRT